MTSEQIIEKLNKRIDYSEIVRLLELDLNVIAQEVLTNPEDLIEFKVFFDYGEFDTAVNAQAPGEGAGFFTTPVLLSLIDGDYSTEKGPQVYQTQFRIEVFAFEKDMENVRAILEVYSSLNQGGVPSDLFAPALTTSITDFPVFTQPIQYKGFTRISAFMTWVLTFIYSGQMANEIKVSIDDDELNLLALNIKRTRVGDSVQRNTESETTTVNTGQSLVFSGSFIYDNSDAANSILNNIKNFGSTDLNTVYSLEVEYPSMEVSDTYSVVLTEGDVNIVQGGYVTIDFVMVIQ